MTSIPQEDLDKALDMATLGLFRSPPHSARKPNPSTFITTIYTGLTKLWDERVPTACVNYKTLEMRINPDWFMSLSEPMRCTLLAHECWHLGFDHGGRLNGRDHRTWNAAADHAINLMLLEFGYHFDQDPDEPSRKLGLLDPQFVDMSAEQIYDILKTTPPPDLCLPFGEDFEMDTEDARDTPGSGATRDMAAIKLVQQALTISTMTDTPGSVPGSIQEYIEELLNPRLPWYKLLSRYMTDLAEHRRDWSHPNRRYLANRLYLPGDGKDSSLGQILFGCDDSASMSTENLQVMNSEMKGVKDQLKPRSMRVVSFDTMLHDSWEFTPEDDLTRLTFTGRGGTNLFPLFELAQKEQPEVLVVMSDLECSLPPKPQGFPVLWIRFGDCGQKPDYGTVINVDR